MNYPTSTVNDRAVGNNPNFAASECQCSPTEPVAAYRLRSLADAELERHIESCGQLMRQAYARYEASSCLGDRGEASRWAVMMADAIRSRGAAQVARMESDRGLA